MERLMPIRNQAVYYVIASRKKTNLSLEGCRCIGCEGKFDETSQEDRQFLTLMKPFKKCWKEIEIY